MLKRLASLTIPRSVLVKPGIVPVLRMPAAGVHIERKLADMGLKIPDPNKPVAKYAMCVRVGNMIYTGNVLRQRLRFIAEQYFLL
jgi:hypothetical protein